MDKTLQDAAQPIAENIFARASVHSEKLEERLEVTLPDGQFNQIILEFVALLLHITDRVAFDLLGGSERSEFIDLIFAHLNAFGTSYSISEKHTASPFVRMEGNIKFVGLNDSLLNQRQIEYAKHMDSSSGSDELNKPDTVTWQFAKHVSDIFAQPTRELEVQEVARAEAVNTYAIFMPLLRELGLPDRWFLKGVATGLLLAFGKIFSEESLLQITKLCEVSFQNEDDHARANQEWFYFGLYAVSAGVQNNLRNKPDIMKAVVREMFSELHSHLVKAGVTPAELGNKLVRIKERFAQFDSLSGTGESERVGYAFSVLALGLKSKLGEIPPTRDAFQLSLAANVSYTGALKATNELFDLIKL